MKVRLYDEEPLEVPESERAFFESLGYRVVEENTSTTPAEPVEEEPEKGADDDLIGAPEVDLNTLTVAQLQEYAQEHEIDLSGTSLKAEILARVQEAVKEN